MKGENTNLIHVLQHGKLPASPYYYIDMELCRYNLEDYLESSRRLGPQARSGLKGLDIKEILDLMEQLASGASYLHDHDIVHGNLKPKNGTTLQETFS